MDGQMGGQTSQPRCSYLPPIDWHSSSPKLLSRPAFICLKTCLYLSNVSHQQCWLPLALKPSCPSGSRRQHFQSDTYRPHP